MSPQETASPQVEPPQQPIAARAPAGEAARDVGRAYVAPGRSALVHLKLVSFVTVLGLLAGFGYAFVGPTSYTSTATLYVGRTLSLSNTAAIAGLSAAATNIAQDYARLIDTATVTTDVEKLMHTQSIDGTLSASVIPQTPEIQVTGTASTPAAARGLAKAGTSALLASVSAINQYNATQLSALQNRYSSLEVQITNENTTIGQLQGTLSAHPTARDAPALHARIQSLETAISGQTLQAQTVYQQYQSNYSPYPAEESVLQVQSAAGPATSNRKKALEIGLVIGVVFAFILGVAAASYIDIRTDRRAASSVPSA